MEDLKYIKYVEEIRLLDEINFYCNDGYIINCWELKDSLIFMGILYNDRWYTNVRYKVVKQALKLLDDNFGLGRGDLIRFDFNESKRNEVLEKFKGGENNEAR